MLGIAIQRENWSGGKVGGALGTRKNSLEIVLELGNQVRGAKPSFCYCLTVFKSRFQSDLWDGEIVKFTFGLNYLCKGS